MTSLLHTLFSHLFSLLTLPSLTLYFLSLRKFLLFVFIKMHQGNESKDSKIASKGEGNERTKIDRIISALSFHEISSFYVLPSSSSSSMTEIERGRGEEKSAERHLQKTNERNYTLWKISQISRASSQCLCSVHWTEFKGRRRENIFFSFSYPSLFFIRSLLNEVRVYEPNFFLFILSNGMFFSCFLQWKNGRKKNKLIW